MALSGNLRDFQIGDIFQLVAQQGKTGTLVIRRKGQTAHIHFRTGQVVRAEPIWEDHPSPLGELLVTAEVITPEQLQQALSRKERTLTRVEETLLALEAVTEDVLREFIRLQTTETIYRLFLWKNGDYEFIPGDIPTGVGWNEPLDAENILMNGFRMVDEWPVIRNTVPASDYTFEVLRNIDGSAVEDRDEKYLPPVTLVPSELEKNIYALIRSGRDIEKLAAISRCGEFETSRAVANLVKGGFIALGARHKRDGEEGSLRGKKLAYAVSRRIARAAFVVLLLAVAAFVVLAWRIKPAQHADDSVNNPQLTLHRTALGQTQLSRIAAALDVYRVEHGEYPSTLDELVATNLLNDGDLTYPFENKYYYRRSKTGYVLHLPFY